MVYIITPANPPHTILSMSVMDVSSMFINQRNHHPSPPDPLHAQMRTTGAQEPRERRYGAGTARLTVTLFFWVKLSSMPSRENSRPMPLCLTPP